LPKSWIFNPNWSDQKYGTRAGGGGSPRMSRATVAAWSPALVQCSWRCRSPRAGSVHAATSPTAHTPDNPSTRPVAPQGRPPGTAPSSGAPSTHPSRGTPPIPTTTTSAVTRDPSASATPSCPPPCPAPPCPAPPCPAPPCPAPPCPAPPSPAPLALPLVPLGWPVLFGPPASSARPPSPASPAPPAPLASPGRPALPPLPVLSGAALPVTKPSIRTSVR